MSEQADVLARFRLDGRTAIVTGASSGLGVGFARTLGAVGANLVLTARRTALLDAVAEALREGGAEVLTCTADVSEEADCAAVVGGAIERFGSVDVLVNNAGVGSYGPALREDPADFRRVIDINLTGAFLMSRACAAHMERGSAIVNVASVLGVVASRFPGAAYAASKAGVIGLTRDLAMQWSGRRGIRVNALAPGYFASEMTAEGSAALEAMVAENSLLGRFGEQTELDGALLYLASPASSYTTGTTLIVDGGLTTTL